VSDAKYSFLRGLVVNIPDVHITDDDKQMIQQQQQQQQRRDGAASRPRGR